VQPICAFLESTSYAAAVKAACRLVGLSAGPVRAPLLEIPAGECTELASLVAAAGIETVDLTAVSA
jgi:dihydrodipicolinate synthase/N-acetylneuraminate lyase